MQPTVFVVDDDADLRHSLEMLLRTMEFAVRSFASAAEFRRFYQPIYPGCLVLDVKMPRQNGLELYRRLLQEGKRLPVIFMTAHAEVTTAVAAMKTGAIEFLAKPFDRSTLIDRIEKALVLDAEWRAREQEFARLGSQIERLNGRERMTLELVVAGVPNKAMARRLQISERAVEMRRATLMRKLGVRNTAELLKFAITYRVLAELRRTEQAGGAGQAAGSEPADQQSTRPPSMD
jgi:FixJ family two-component response regulator